MSTPKSNVTMPYDYKVKGYAIDNGGGEGGGGGLVVELIYDTTEVPPRLKTTASFKDIHDAFLNGENINIYTGLVSEPQILFSITLFSVSAEGYAVGLQYYDLNDHDLKYTFLIALTETDSLSELVSV